MYKDKLDEIFQLQKDLKDFIVEKQLNDGTEHPFFGPDRYEGERIFYLATAIIHEAIEVQRETSYKWWKKNKPIDMNKVKEETIDIVFFVVQLCIEVGLTPDDILQEYKKKHEINVKRQQQNY